MADVLAVAPYLLLAGLGVLFGVQHWMLRRTLADVQFLMASLTTARAYLLVEMAARAGCYAASVSAEDLDAIDNQMLARGTTWWRGGLRVDQGVLAAAEADAAHATKLRDEMLAAFKVQVGP